MTYKRFFKQCEEFSICGVIGDRAEAGIEGAENTTLYHSKANDFVQRNVLPLLFSHNLLLKKHHYIFLLNQSQMPYNKI